MLNLFYRSHVTIARLRMQHRDPASEEHDQRTRRNKGTHITQIGLKVR